MEQEKTRLEAQDACLRDEMRSGLEKFYSSFSA
jgi:hypothetical protein